MAMHGSELAEIVVHVLKMIICYCQKNISGQPLLPEIEGSRISISSH